MVERVNKDVAERIDQSIQSLGLSYGEVSKRLGVTSATVWNWAKGKHAISIDKCRELASSLGVSDAYLAFGIINGNASSVSVGERDVVSVPEKQFEETFEGKSVREWRLSSEFLHEVSPSMGVSSCFLFRTPSKVDKVSSPGDLLIVDGGITERSSRLFDGVYLLFNPFVPETVHISVGFQGGLKYFIKRGTLTTVEDPSKIRPILGKVVGIIKKLDN